jgi:triosephosphate isomerase
MRKKLVVGNWKMNTDSVEAEDLVNKIKESKISLALTEIVICPPFLYIPKVSEILEDTVIKIGAQNCFWEEEGAYTGEISSKQLEEYCDYVICGHSERRKYQKESDKEINKKVKAAANTGLGVILAIGEHLEDYRKGNWEIVLDQLAEGLKGLTPGMASKITVAYEPVWAIGTGEAATPDYVNKIAVRIRQEAGGILGRENAEKMRILYGGSVDRDNAAKFVQAPEVDGLLVGGASIKPLEFINIIKNVNKVKS